MKNKIGWCSMTWNPVWGCLNHCPYCYARKIAKRFANVIARQEHNHRYWGNTKDRYMETEKREILVINKSLIKRNENEIKTFTPTFIYSQFHKKLPKKPQKIFVGSMSEIYYWKDEWLEMVLEKTKLCPQHIFQFLTRYPEVYDRYIFPKNCWLGVTVTKENDINNEHFKRFRTQYIVFLLDINTHNIDNKRFISFEPLLENINTDFLNSSSINWVIIGAETGNRKGKVIPKIEWIDKIVIYCRKNNIPVYLKDSLKGICPVEIKEFPKTEL